MDNLNVYIKQFLQDLTTRQVKDIAGPEKRASVAIVIRLRSPHSAAAEQNSYSQRPQNLRGNPYSCCNADDIQNAFEQAWAKNSIAEILFIKRASRVGDRWTGHIALPGGRRDRSDGSDEMTAVRECVEEVGLDLTSNDALLCGALPQRVIITNWGQKPLMVLCPFVFLWTRDGVPEFRLQASEVAAAFWIPINSLVDKRHRTQHPVDVSDRMASSSLPALKPFFNLILGPMYFSAIHLKPEEVLYSPTEGNSSTKANVLVSEKLVLWGITYAVLADMLDFFPPFDFVELFKYPSFAGWDFKVLVWIFARGYRLECREYLRKLRTRDTRLMPRQHLCARGAGISMVDYLMSGYYVFVREAAYIAVLIRLIAIGGLVGYAKHL